MNWIITHRIPILICTTLLIAFAIRVYSISDIPKGFFADEASIGYNAYSLLMYGRDEHGKFYPIFFEAFGEYKNPLQIYATIPFIMFFDLSVFSVRLTSVILSLVSIYGVFLLTSVLTKKLAHSKEIGLLAMLLLTISPWHIHFSRTSFEGFMPFLFLVSFGTYFFLRSHQTISFLYLSTISFCLSLYSYFPARLFVPLFVLGIACFNISFLIRHKRRVLLNLLLGLLFLIPLVLSTVFDNGLSRWRQVNIFSNPPKQHSVEEHIISNYLSHFSPDYLFIKGDIDMPGQSVMRHSVRGFGELYLFQLPFLFIGLYVLYARKMYESLFILILWFVLYPIGSMFTMEESVNATRSIVGVIPFQILTAIGIYAAMAFLTIHLRRFALAFAIILSGILIYSFSLYSHAYFYQYNLYSSGYWGWQYGMPEIIEVFKVNESKYDELILMPEFNGGQTLMRFFAPHSCTKCSIAYPHERLSIEKKQLFAVTPEYLVKHPEYTFTEVNRVFYPNHTVAFLIGEIVE